jgi:DNA-binding NarL/FixJ family response regulator
MTTVRLTSREQQLVSLVCEDLSYLVIAERMGISGKTVEHYVRRVAERLPEAAGRGARAIRKYFGPQMAPAGGATPQG